MRSTPDAYQWSAKVLTGVRQHLLNLRAKPISTTPALTSLPLRQATHSAGLTSFFTTSLYNLRDSLLESQYCCRGEGNGEESESTVAGRSDRERQAFLLQTCDAIHRLAGPGCRA